MPISEDFMINMCGLWLIHRINLFFQSGSLDQLFHELFCTGVEGSIKCSPENHHSERDFHLTDSRVAGLLIKNSAIFGILHAGLITFPFRGVNNLERLWGVTSRLVTCLLGLIYLQMSEGKTPLGSFLYLNDLSGKTWQAFITCLTNLQKRLLQ